MTSRLLAFPLSFKYENVMKLIVQCSYEKKNNKYVYQQLKDMKFVLKIYFKFVVA